MNPFQRFDPIVLAQKFLEAGGAEIGATFIDAIDAIVAGSLWNGRRNSSGQPFDTFGQFALADLPQGLGANNSGAFRTLRFALLERKHYRPLVEILRLGTRQRGRPSKILADGENFRFTVPTSSNSLDRILLRLDRQAQPLLEDVYTGKITPRQAALAAGLLKARPKKLDFGVCDLAKASRIPIKAQGDLLCQAFKTLSLDAQCTLLSRAIEPVLGPGLAEAWRTRKTRQER